MLVDETIVSTQKNAVAGMRVVPAADLRPSVHSLHLGVNVGPRLVCEGQARHVAVGRMSFDVIDDDAAPVNHPGDEDTADFGPGVAVYMLPDGTQDARRK